MDRHTSHRSAGVAGAHRGRTPRRGALAVAVLLTGAALVASTTAAADEAASTGGTPTAEQVAARQELRRVVGLMPTGWPATEAMRRLADEPLGATAAPDAWRDVVDRMPVEWRATQVMRDALDG